MYHALNRANARTPIFETDEDYAAFERVLALAVTRHDMRLLAYCVMPNHFHLLLWPRADGDLSAFMRWTTLTHTQRWHARRRTAGSGHLYQGRFKSFPVQSDEHFLTVCRYVERERAAGEPGRAGRGLAVGEPVGPAGEGQGRGRAAGAGGLADRAAAQLDGAGEPAVRRRRGGGDRAEHPAGPAVRCGRLAGGGGVAAGAGVGIPASRPTQEGGKRLLTPLFCE